MKKIILIVAFLSLTIQAHAATYYFSNSTGGYITTLGSNSNNGTSTATPFLDFNGTTLDNSGALSPGDIVYFDGGDTWNLEEIISSSDGTVSNRITFSCYNGTGACTTDQWVKFYWSNEYTDFVQVGATATWEKTGLSQTHLKVVLQTYNGEVRPLLRWNGTNLNVPEGAFCRSATGVDPVTGAGRPCNVTQGPSLFINPWGTGNPNTQTVRVPPNAHSVGYSDGTRGLISTSRAAGLFLGKYNTFKRFWILGANGVGFSSSTIGTYFENCRITGAGMDGVLSYVGPNTGTATEYGEEMRWYGTVDPTKDGEAAAQSIIEWSAVCASGCGQGYSSYGPRSAVYQTVARYNGMAGIDILDVRPTWSGDGFLVAHNLSHHNGVAIYNPSYDPNIYLDGASNGTVIGNIVWGSGTVDGATNSRANISIGSEHNVDYGKVSHNIDIVNNLSYMGHNKALGTNNAGSPAAGADVADIYDIRMIGNTLVAYDAGTSEKVLLFIDANTALTDSYVFKNNLVIADNSDAALDLQNPTTFYDGDYNLWFRRGASTAILKINGTNKTLAEFRTDTSEEANSINADPLLVDPNETTLNARLQYIAEGYAADSPAINAGLEGAWTPQAYLATYFSDIMPLWTYTGSTRVDGALDEVATNINIGFHYPTSSLVSESAPPEPGYGALTSTNVEPASLYSGSSGNLTVSFTTQTELPADAKIELTLPTTLGSGFTINNGGTTAAGSLTGLTGSLSTSVASNIITLTRQTTVSDPENATLDTFTRANVGPPPSASWTTHNGDGWKVISNQCSTQTTSAGYSNDYWNVASFTNSEVYAKVVTKPVNGKILDVKLRWTTASDTSYSIRVVPNAGTDVITINYYDGATNTALATYNRELAANDTMRLLALGTSLTAFVKPSGGSWEQLGASVTHATLTSGRIGLFAQNSTAVVIDDFGGGTATVDPISGATISSPGAKSFVLSFIKVPTIAGSTGTYILKTKTSAEVVIDQDLIVPADTIINNVVGTLTITVNGVQMVGNVRFV